MNDDATAWETAVLDGGPAHGLRVRVSDRPPVLQVVRPCTLEDDSRDPAVADGDAAEARVQALYVYRRTSRQPLRYGFDPASP